MIDPTTMEHPTGAGILRPFLGVKERRRSSSAKVTLGDDLRMATDALGAKALAKHGISVVVFSAHCLKVNRRDELKRRILVVSDVGVLLMDERTKRIRRKFAWKDLKCVRMSVYADDFFALIAPDEYDVLCACNRKTEAIVAMRKMWKRYHRSAGTGAVDENEVELSVEASEKFTFMASATRERRVEFVRVGNGDVDVDIVDVDEDVDEDEEDEEA
jgi:hypothetical protein